MMNKNQASERHYSTLCRVLDALRYEIPRSNREYHPVPATPDALIQARSRALLHLFLKARFGLISYRERLKCITDGPHDGGVDAFYVDEKSKKIFLLQSKFRASASNFIAHNMSADDVLKMDVKRILKGEKKDENGILYNDSIKGLLQRTVQKIPDVGSYTTQVILLGNSKTFTPLQLKKLVEGYAVDQYHHERIYSDLLFPVVNGTYYTEPNLKIEINLTNVRGESNLDYDVKTKAVKSNIKILFVPTKEIGRIMHTYKNSILKYNPRSFLELQKNPVNQQIASSIEDEVGNSFALFNNGITIISDGTSISSETAKQGVAQVVLRNPQLVNGGQTAFTLSRIYEKCLAENDFSVFKNKEVLLRVITFVGPERPIDAAARIELMGEISKASNSQTKIEESDRRSNDPIQIELQKAFFEKYGMYYERKLGEFSDGIASGYIDQTSLVNRERLIRIGLACDYRANQARSSISRFFKDETTLATLLKLRDVNKYAYGYEVLRLLELKRKGRPLVRGDRYHIKQFGQALRYAQYAVVAVCANKGPAKHKSELQVVDLVLSQWVVFESWVQKKKTNQHYKVEGAFDFVNYYKGATINSDLKEYSFSI
jgi:AIPR protein